MARDQYISSNVPRSRAAVLQKIYAKLGEARQLSGGGDIRVDAETWADAVLNSSQGTLISGVMNVPITMSKYHPQCPQLGVCWCEKVYSDKQESAITYAIKKWVVVADFAQYQNKKHRSKKLRSEQTSPAIFNHDIEYIVFGSRVHAAAVLKKERIAKHVESYEVSWTNCYLKNRRGLKVIAANSEAMLIEHHKINSHVKKEMCILRSGKIKQLPPRFANRKTKFYQTTTPDKKLAAAIRIMFPNDMWDLMDLLEDDDA